MSLPITYTIDETFKLLQERADKEAALSDQFYLKVFRRRQLGTRTSEHVATFSGASIVHFAQPEAWLPGLLGGGDYEIYAYDPADPSKRIGGLITASYPVDVNPVKMKPDFKTALASPQWRGPRGLVFPDQNDIPQLAGASSPQATTVISMQPNSNGQSQSAAVPEWYAREKQEAEKKTQDLMLQLERERADRRTFEEQQRARAEVERIRAESEARIRDLEARVMAASQQKPSGPDTATMISTLLGALAPVVLKFIDSASETRKLEALRADQAQQATQTMLAKLAEPRGMPPEVTMLFEVMKGQANSSGEMMARMVEATSAFNGMATSMIETMAQHLGGQEGNPILDGAKDIIKTIASMQRGTEQAGRRQAQQMVQTAQQLPASQPQYPTAAHMPQQYPPASATAVGPQTPVQSVTPAPMVATPSQSGFSGLPPVSPQDTVAAVEGLIRNHADPAQVVDFIIGRIQAKDQALFNALDEHNGDVESLIGDRLGGWAIIAENNAYLDRLGDAWAAKASAAGLLEEEPAEHEEAR